MSQAMCEILPWKDPATLRVVTVPSDPGQA
jgi:hypothetical protein